MHPRKISFILFFATLFLIGYLHLSTPLLTVLFSYLLLSILRFKGKKWVAVSLFLVVVSVLIYASFLFVREALITLPEVAEKSIPAACEFLEKKGVQLPFADYEALRPALKEGLKAQVKDLTKFLQLAGNAQALTREFVVFIIGIVIAISIFLGGKIDLGQGSYEISDNLYSAISNELALRFIVFYRSFAMVMGAQLLISLINTIFTTIFVLSVRVPYPYVVIAITFLCGLLPIIGNLISNTIICLVAITRSPSLAAMALLFLVVLHKFEYFLNSKIIGGRIKNPMWLTLLALIVGERIMGIPGMILAPVLLHYLKVEGSQIAVQLQPPIDAERRDR